MANESTLTRHNVLDAGGLRTLLATIFDIINRNWVRRSEFEDALRTVTNRINALDALEAYQFSLDADNGDMVLEFPDDETVDMEIEGENLVVTVDEGSNAEAILSRFHFDIVDQYLILTV